MSRPEGRTKVVLRMFRHQHEASIAAVAPRHGRARPIRGGGAHECAARAVPEPRGGLPSDDMVPTPSRRVGRVGPRRGTTGWPSRASGPTAPAGTGGRATRRWRLWLRRPRAVPPA